VSLEALPSPRANVRVENSIRFSITATAPRTSTEFCTPPVRNTPINEFQFKTLLSWEQMKFSRSSWAKGIGDQETWRQEETWRDEG
jgi:hypothetical protein